MVKAILSIVLSLCFYLLGTWQRSLVLLDVPFGFAYFVIDSLGLWRPGPLWVGEHRFLSLFCFLGWLLILSTAFSYTTMLIAEQNLEQAVEASSFVRSNLCGSVCFDINSTRRAKHHSLFVFRLFDIELLMFFRLINRISCTA